ncbi:MAG: response regulator [Dehalococcoidia bacterium]|jgi:two-component system alkaline phosphatase synthesis response regulator PhoP
MEAQDKKTILLVEDEISFRTIYQDMLESGNFNVLTAEDGEAGLNIALTQKPDLVLLDLNLPKLHGFEVLQKIRADESTSKMPVIILTVQGSDKEINKGTELGATDYLIKGICTAMDTFKRINAALSAAKPTITVYKVEVKERLLDAIALEDELHLGLYFNCPGCRMAVSLELTPDPVKDGKHSFSARFVCPLCKKEF